MIELSLKIITEEAMSTKMIFIFFILLSTLLISITILFEAKPIYEARAEKMRLLTIQHVYHKHYFRSRNIDEPKRSIPFAQEKINNIMKNSDIIDNNSSIKNYKVLAKIISVLNNLKNKAILEIKVYRDKNTSKQDNLKLSQQEAELLKEYINKRTKIAFISAIGYGEELKDKNKHRDLEINLKRIK